MASTGTPETVNDGVDDVMESRKQEAASCMPEGLLRMVQQREVLTCRSSSTTFTLTSVLDGGGFASLLKGRLRHSPSSSCKVGQCCGMHPT